MNKNELVEDVQQRLNATKAEAAAAVNAILAAVQDEVVKGGKVTIAGFGVFEKRTRNARTARNPHTGEVLAVAAKQAPTFRPGAAFKQAVASGN